MKSPLVKTSEGLVYCPICTHTVPAAVEYSARRVKVVSGQKCRRCHSSLDAAAVYYTGEAA